MSALPPPTDKNHVVLFETNNMEVVALIVAILKKKATDGAMHGGTMLVVVNTNKLPDQEAEVKILQQTIRVALGDTKTCDGLSVI